ncbi:ASKHA domain-containing protein [Nocardioides halotolerans]|uniref:ASKHA domain-containing protein n=1 Tax=Nocardioides halotolerans TaxID=433660 RepID=UPI00040E02FC|nr:ASKHA domain-containing protein [Nocardioides halotolerans]
MSDSVEEFDPDALRREGLIASPGAEAVAHDGTGRVDLAFTVEERVDGKDAPPTQRSVRVPPGVTVFDSASWNGIAIDSTCGGHGTCHKCKVRLTPATPATRHDVRTFSREQLDDGWRLACLARATRNHEVVVPPLTTRPKAATVGVGRQVILRPAVQKRYVELSEPTLEDQVTDLDRLLAAIDDLEPRADLHVLRRLPRVLRAGDFKVTAVVVDEELIDVEPGDTTGVRYAVAFDLGTTTVVATLLDLVTGTPVAVASMLNKQQPFGGDVISRISATMLDPDALERLRVAACDTLAELAAQVCREGGVDPAHVYEAAVAGNATMTALALGIDPEPLGVAPFVMSTAMPPTVLATDLGLGLHPRARVMMFPALGAYVGGDIVAGMLASGMDRDKRTRLFIDVGTNCEIVLSDGDRIVSTAAPAGPAFEGGAIRCGMRADDGAIEVVTLTPEGEAAGVALGVIGDVAPKGLCGSGLVDAVAELVRVGLLDATGRFVADDVAKELAPGLADRLTTLSSNRGEERVFVLHRPAVDADPADCVVLSQRDVRELQFAKAAISTGWTLLLEELGLEHRDVQQVLLAGSFGSYLSAASAIRIGLVPKLPVLRIVAAGNVAGEGAKMALLSIRERAGAQALLEEVTYVELSDRPEFNDKFVEQLAF